ncbi:diguanylate cyclase [Acidovorax sp. SRB_14]|uniref:sensor domain-containing diguanylate cyclase n=1 Tax=unclassified Acidovorax TaxID=2684926 RepID=UPI00145E4F4A|nr:MULTISPECIES: sensor domain-containing diguanylate cyclase [unclassified Acidovorax]NMM77994.1 diguanylate cyclase [Acidovorax sp. SRB_24]NMM79420.1 diguanylate cyclase [Acidovorax sp. SRB_14]NMM84672.1 diguanylate cyclase [Rhodococcus sp. SRB_17]
MTRAPLFRIHLRSLILLLATVSAALTLANGLYASYTVQRQQLIDNALESNRVYARKLADSVEGFLQSAQQQLAYSAGVVAERFGDEGLLADEAERLRLQTNSFNSVLFADDGGWVRATSPETLQLKGRQLHSPGIEEALRVRSPTVSLPYLAQTGNLLVFISHPVIDRAGRYHGLVGGSIYLKQTSILHSLLGEHYYRDGSYLYVVDHSRRLIYHPDAARLGQQVAGNAVIDAVLRSEPGEQRVVNSLGVDMLAGYAPVATAGWGVVAQRPVASALSALDGLMQGVLYKTLPLAAVLMGLIWWSAWLIARPLWQLADGARHMDRAGTADSLRHVRSWYFETSELRRAMLVGVNLLHQKIGKLHRDVRTDPLTGLDNRRGLDLSLALWQAEQRPFAAVALDVDHFKQVNDIHGHDAGDLVLQRLAELMRSCSREQDVLCRLGGEEFVMLLPDVAPAAAEQVAQRLRQLVERTSILPVGQITISLGVAQWPLHVGEAAQVLKAADQALYRAKHTGRNRVVLAGQEEETAGVR